MEHAKELLGGANALKEVSVFALAVEHPLLYGTLGALGKTEVMGLFLVMNRDITLRTDGDRAETGVLVQ